MARWKYELKCGKKLRKAINESTPYDVLNVLRDAYGELLGNGIIDEDDFDRWTSDFELYDEDVDEYDVDYELGEFYDLCDNLGIWIPLF